MAARIGLMLGDATGIGPEVAVKALAAGPLPGARVGLCADRRVLALGERAAGATLPARPCRRDPAGATLPARPCRCAPATGSTGSTRPTTRSPLIDLARPTPPPSGGGAVNPASGRIVGETLSRMIEAA